MSGVRYFQEAIFSWIWWRRWWSVAVLAKTLWGGGPPSGEWGAIISSRWKNWGCLDKKWGGKAPRPRPRTATLMMMMMMTSDMVVRYKPATEDQLMKAFQTLDTEGQGFLTQEQLSKLMMEEGEHRQSAWMQIRRWFCYNIQYSL